MEKERDLLFSAIFAERSFLIVLGLFTLEV